jgi:multidrug efflux pump subunit AcrB
MNHQGQFLSVTISFNLKGNAPLGVAVSAIQQQMAALHVPPSISASFQGNALAFQSSLSWPPSLRSTSSWACCMRTRGLDAEQSIYEACKLRFRPILMTTMCALLGSLPLTLVSGTGCELRQPLGYAMAGGLVVSQILTLFTTPVVYIYMDRSPRFASAVVEGHARAKHNPPNDPDSRR